jgi:hypothetical protein
MAASLVRSCFTDSRQQLLLATIGSERAAAINLSPTPQSLTLSRLEHRVMRDVCRSPPDSL